MSVSFPFVFMQKSTFDRACFGPRAVCLTTLVYILVVLYPSSDKLGSPHEKDFG